MKITKEQFALLENYDLKIREKQREIASLKVAQEAYLVELIKPKKIEDVVKVTNTEIIFKEEKVESTDQTV